MTVTAPTKAPPKETWRDWMHPGTPEPEPLLTRAEFLDRVRAEGGDVSERTLAYWEKHNVLPHPVRRWHNGKSATLYPEWLIAAVTTVRVMQEMGESLAEIRRTIRDIYRLPPSDDEQSARQAAYDAAVKALNGPIFALARQWEQWAQEDVNSLTIVIRGSGEKSMTLDFSIALQQGNHRSERPNRT